MRFASYHPALSALFFAAVLVCAACFDHPVYAGIGATGALAASVALRGRHALAFDAAALVAGALWAAGFAATTHFGVTVLGYTIEGNRITLEAASCGAVQGIRLAAVLIWASCAVAVFTSDKVVFLLGRVSPRLSLAAAMILRLIPRTDAQRRAQGCAQAGIGRGPGQGGALVRVCRAGQRAGALVDAVIAGLFQAHASGVARGVRLRGRSAFALYRFDNRDRALVLALVALITVTGVAASLGQTGIQYNPTLAWLPLTAPGCAFMAAYAALCLTPTILESAAQVHCVAGQF